MEQISTRVDELVPDCLFPTDNDLEVPTLRLDMQAEVCDIPFMCFGEQKRTHNMGGAGTLHFYTDDYRFNAVYEHPEKILQHNPRNIVEPNFSQFNDMPIAFGLQAIYKKRWIARMMQEKGLRVFVDLNVNSRYYKLNMLGVPRGWKSFCTRGYSDRLHYLEFEYNIANEWADGAEPVFVIYGGGAACKDFAQKHNCVYVSSMVAMRNTAVSMKKISGTIEFVEDEFDTKRIVEQSVSKLYNNQVLDFREHKMIE